MFGFQKKLKIQESIPSQVEIVPEFISSTMEKLYHFPLDEDVIFNTKLCLQEAVINAVKHGNQSDINKKVKVLITVDKNQLIMEVTDQGAGFNEKDVPDPTDEENILKLSGRGVFLIRQLMNKVQYKNGGRTIRMVKVLPKGRRVKVDVQVEQLNDVSLVVLDGEVNVNNAMDLRESFSKIIDGGGKKVSVDFEKVSFIDSAGLAVLIETFKRLQEVSGHLRLCNVNRKIKGIFEITKMHKLLDIYESRDLALKDF